VTRQFPNEHSGYITLSGPDSLSVPFYAAPRPASDMSAAGGLSFGMSAISATLALRGVHVDTQAYRSRVWALELQEQNVDDYFTSGVQNAGDIKYVGVGSDIERTGALTKDTLIYFGVATFGPWSTPGSQDSRFVISIDTDGDLIADYGVLNWNLSQAGGGVDASDVFVSAVIDVARDVVVSTRPASALFNSSVLVLPVAAGDLGLAPGKSRFSYSMFAFQRETAGPSDGTDIHTFDPAAPALSLGGAPLLDDLNGRSAALWINRGSWLRDEAQGLLLLHELNAAPDQAEMVPVEVAFHRLFAPVVGR
jgi:hypothetical protein